MRPNNGHFSPTQQEVGMESSVRTEGGKTTVCPPVGKLFKQGRDDDGERRDGWEDWRGRQ